MPAIRKFNLRKFSAIYTLEWTFRIFSPPNIFRYTVHYHGSTSLARMWSELGGHAAGVWSLGSLAYHRENGRCCSYNHIPWDWDRHQPTKLLCLGTLLDEQAGKKACTKRDLQYILGSLNHACKAIRPGRSFMCNMLELLWVAYAHHHHIRVN